MRDLDATLIQAELFWENRERNLEKFSRILENLARPTDVVVLPEMFNTGFSMHAEVLAEAMDGPTVRWLAAQAALKGCAVTGSIIIDEGGRYVNRLIWMRPDGSCDHYDKRHLFRMAGEHEHFTAGTRRLVVDVGGWRICPLICYDLRFPVWSRNRDDYDVLVYIANWPKPRRSAWKALLRARAIENQSYVIGVNRIGRDGRGKAFSGDSAVFDPRGVRLSRIRPHEECVEAVTLSYQRLIDFRAKFRVLLDADEFDLIGSSHGRFDNRPAGTHNR